MPDEKEIIEETPKITFGQFNEFYKVNNDLDNAEIYKAFPTIKEGTLRSWKAKAKAEAEAPPDVEEEEPPEVEIPEEEEKTPMTKKEIDDLVAKKVKEALKIERKTPSDAVPTDQPVSREEITKNWFEVIV